jgi:hypothetical protein
VNPPPTDRGLPERAFASDLFQLLMRGLIEFDADRPGEVDGRVRIQPTAAGRAAITEPEVMWDGTR